MTPTDLDCPGCTPDVRLYHDDDCMFAGIIEARQHCRCRGLDFDVIHSQWCEHQPGGGAFARWPRPEPELEGDVLSAADYDDPFGRALVTVDDDGAALS